MIDPVTRGLGPALVTVLMAFAPSGLEGCKKLGGGSGSAAEADVPPPPPPSPSATTPPIWAPPETAAPPSLGGAPPVGADLARARQLAQAGDNKKVRALLEKKVRAGRASRDEASVLLDACIALRDKACVEATRGKYPDAAAD